MGVRGLTRNLRPYAERSKLSGRIVIDGPGLAYYIHHVSRVQNAVATALEEPSFLALGIAAVQFLDRIQSCGVQIAAIYFDGFLPEAKREERLDRVRQNSIAASNYFSATVLGIPSPTISDTETCSTPKTPSNRHNGRIPVSSFLVPAVLDALRASKYGPLTQLVPGEADPFCAQDVCQNSGTILTSDSDLLLYDLGEEGSVMFFSDIETVGSSELEALAYKQGLICSKLSLESGQASLLSLAFEMTIDHDQTLEAYLSLAKQRHSATTHAEEYGLFASQYMETSCSDTEAPDFLDFLDPRVSELVLTCQKLNSSSESTSVAENAVMYLPLLLDRWDQASAWIPSAPIRQLAYSICTSADPRLVSVAEYRRSLSNGSKGQAVDLLRSEAEIHSAAQDLLDQISGICVQGSKHIELQWLALALVQETFYATDEGKESLTLRLWQKASKSNGRLDPGNWDVLHLTAQVQGALYSLRMLHQILQCREGMHGAASPSLVKLLSQVQACLAALPTTAEFPSAIDVGGLFGRLHKAGLLGNLALRFGLEEPFAFEGSAREARRKKRQAEGSRQAKVKNTANMFDLLDNDT